VEAAFTADYKSALQEWLQSRDRGLPVYRLAAETGPPHRRCFEVEVLVGGEPVARAEGTSKKEAAQAAAKAALAILNQSR
jgi:ribonuclease-3